MSSATKELILENILTNNLFYMHLWTRVASEKEKNEVAEGNESLQTSPTSTRGMTKLVLMLFWVQTQSVKLCCKHTKSMKLQSVLRIGCNQVLEVFYVFPMTFFFMFY